MPDRRDRDRHDDYDAMEYGDVQESAKKQLGGFELTSIALPKGVELFRFKEEKPYRLDLVPFRCKDGNPNCGEGRLWYERTYYTHRGVGAEPKDHYCCLRKNWGRPCPVCEYQSTLQRQGKDEKTVKHYAPKKRQLFAWIDRKDKPRGTQVYEGNYWKGLGEMLDNKVTGFDEDTPSAQRNFHRHKGGCTLVVNARRISFKTDDGGGAYVGPVDVTLEPRAEDLSADVMRKAVCLDDLPRPLCPRALKGRAVADYTDRDWQACYEELKRVLHEGEGGSDEEGRVERDNPHSAAGGAVGNDEPPLTAEEMGLKVGGRVTWKGGDYTIVSVSKDRTKCDLEDDAEELHRGVPCGDLKGIDKTPDDDDEDDGVPAARASKSKDDDGGDFDDEFGDDEDTPPQRGRTSRR